MSLHLGVQIICIAVLAMFALAGCDAMPGRPRQADRPILPSEVTAFTALYGQNCAGCHGAYGRLGAARPLNDPIYLALVPRERLRTIIAQGVPDTAMPAFSAGAGGALTEAQIDALVSDMVTRWSQPALVQDLTLPPRPSPLAWFPEIRSRAETWPPGPVPGATAPTAVVARGEARSWMRPTWRS